MNGTESRLGLPQKWQGEGGGTVLQSRARCTFGALDNFIDSFQKARLESSFAELNV